MFELDFTTRVLGVEAVERLRKHRILQTIRSQSSKIVKAWQNGEMKPTDEINIRLDGSRVGRAYLAHVTPEDHGLLNAQDATLGGFPSVAHLHRALLRAGYRFKPLSEYQLYRVRFSWIEEVPA